MQVLVVRPLGYVRLSQIPIMPSTHILEKTEPALGVPLPSTVLGLVGAALGIRLSREEVSNDPLQGIGVLVDKLMKKGLGAEDSVILGPLLRLGDGVLAVPVYSRKGTLFIPIDPGKGAPNIDPENPRIDPRKDVVAQAVVYSAVGVKISKETKVVEAGYTFRRSFSWLVDKDGKPITFEYIYVLPRARSDYTMKTMIRLGGEGRQAMVSLSSAVAAGLDKTLERVAPRLATPCTAEEGYYMLLSPWPLLPCNITLSYEANNFLEPILAWEDVVGVPGTTCPRVYIIKLGLGFSEVAKQRRPVIPALPSGTIVRIRKQLKCHTITRKLFMAGYASLLKLD